MGDTVTGPCRCWAPGPPIPHEGHCCFGDHELDELTFGTPPPCGHWKDTNHED